MKRNVIFHPLLNSQTNLNVKCGRPQILLQKNDHIMWLVTDNKRQWKRWRGWEDSHCVIILMSFSFARMGWGGGGEGCKLRVLKIKLLISNANTKPKTNMMLRCHTVLQMHDICKSFWIKFRSCWIWVCLPNLLSNCVEMISKVEGE